MTDQTGGRKTKMRRRDMRHEGVKQQEEKARGKGWAWLAEEEGCRNVGKLCY